MNISHVVTIEVPTEFGKMKVDFTIVDVINRHQEIYALIAQHRLVIGQFMDDNTWMLSKSIDLLDIPI